MLWGFLVTLLMGVIEDKQLPTGMEISYDGLAFDL
jgi:hypothetical protein